MTHTELAWELAELFGDLNVDDINQVCARNVPLETLRFFDVYADTVADAEGINGETRKRLPNLLLLGYLLRILEERLLEAPEEGEPNA
jgi:hypothetical protein